ncbi:protein kinase C [Pyronema omphalodes]|nr:protein kinase C [Pyronema omphalodes]
MADKTTASMQDVHRKIEREKVLINGARAMRSSTDNTAVQQRLDNQIRESQRNLEYLEGKYKELEGRLMGQNTRGMENMQVSDNAGYGGYGNDMMPPQPPFAQEGGAPKTRANFSKLDLIKYDTPHLGPRIQLMLSQLEFKLSVEKQYKEGIEKMAKLYQLEGDRRSRQDAESKRIESNQKIQLLKQALKRYEDLHVDIDFGADEADDDSINAPNIRKPLTGRLQIRILAVKDVDHASTSRFARGPETFVVIKVEDMTRIRTKSTRNDKWLDEGHDIDVDKANEIEITVYDKPGEHPLPIGMLWIRISDLVEELRRKKVAQDLNSEGWISADKMSTGGQGRASDGGNYAGVPPSAAAGGAPPFAIAGQGRVVAQGPTPAGGDGQAQSGAPNIDAWFSLEPVGQIHLSLNFAKYNRGKQAPAIGGLGRQGAVRAKKEEVHEMYGHKFIQQQFYNIMRCALCGELLKYSAGMQCSDCKYTCHKKCYPKVVTKCISKSNSDTDPEEEKLNHRIPHRFEGTTNLGANWCCHCGYMLPVGKKNARKCTGKLSHECALTCHTQCMHLVPDFCGMSMEAANTILAELRTKKMLQKKNPPMADRTMRPAVPAADNRPVSYGDGRQQSFPSPTSNMASSAAGAAYGSVPQSPQSPSQRYPPPAPYTPQPSARTDSASAAATAALLAAQQGRPPSGPTGQYPYGGYGSPVGTPTTQTSPGYPAKNVRPIPGQPPQPNAPYQPGPPPNALYKPQAPGQLQTIPPPPPGAPPSQAVVAQPPAQSAGSRQKIGLDHFNFLAVLGKGNFGKVMLAETKQSKQLYAIKVLKKEFIIENDEVESTRSEKRVFLIANKERHPFLLNLHACFQTETRVYFVMEYISGGDLMLHIQRSQFGAKRAQFYAAEVCLALKYFHENGVIYRDLKLDNILLTLDGHIKIADYGLCKEDMYYGSTTSTFCGTPEFMAPEILMDKRYGRSVDWWAFGVLIYQMLLQQSPFRGDDEDEIYDAILADEPLYPIHMPRDSVSILQKLLTREPEMRLGSGPGDANDVMAHAFFRNINWDDIYHKRIEPPYKPQIQNATDTSNFDQEFTSVTPVLTPVQSVLTQAMQEEFRGFSYVQDSGL